MFLPEPRDMLDEMIAEYGLPYEFRSLITKYLDLSPAQKDAVVEYMRQVAADLMSQTSAEKPVPPGYSSRAELEAEADEFAAMAREQFLLEKIPEYQASSVPGSEDGSA